MDAWKGGGPGGANWNAFELRCRGDIQTTCAQGEVQVEIHVGSKRLTRRSLPLKAGAAQVRELLSMERWWDHLDAETPKGPHYRTGVFRLTATLTCAAPDRADLATRGFAEVVAWRAFVAGFAGGE